MASSYDASWVFNPSILRNQGKMGGLVRVCVACDCREWHATDTNMGMNIPDGFDETMVDEEVTIENLVSVISSCPDSRVAHKNGSHRSLWMRSWKLGGGPGLERITVGTFEEDLGVTGKLLWTGLKKCRRDKGRAMERIQNDADECDCKQDWYPPSNQFIELCANDESTHDALPLYYHRREYFQQPHYFRKATDEAYNRKLGLAPHHYHALMSVDTMGGGGFIGEVYDDPHNNFFRLSQQSLALQLPSPGFHLPSLFSARRLLDVVFHHQMNMFHKIIPNVVLQSSCSLKLARGAYNH
ncbi:uncharacterized protein HD556DRAFT_1303887 [Suillus plorans]|uniref:Uncharacterized protein n=1 Tax=Suillus plorans TaxID=116603 RepID=A0A9P7J5P8_9AGAM|nr:uncharacterized protein HD556DRAFT_1303887 [Suillus plorans]KAG1803904.1 hypothetical protein HD556DRAFT_1303887 [Suillus plorans]